MAAAGIVEATRSYESWMERHLRVIPGDLAYKHRMMAADEFSFLRATYYRWVELWPAICPELARLAPVLAAGDVHVENFGTWRDIEGRLVWGLNDFDEAHSVAWPNDIVRLAVSALLATRRHHLRITVEDACRAIVTGYRQCISGQGRPFVLGEQDRWLREHAQGELRDPVIYWGRMSKLPVADRVPGKARDAMAKMLPRGSDVDGVRVRRAGLGSLGRPRFVTLGSLHGGAIAREAKGFLPPAAEWATDQESERVLYKTVLQRAVRCPDPYFELKGGWIVRRLAPDCSRVELAALPVKRDEARLLRAMGWEIANVHLGNREAVPAIRRQLSVLAEPWLRRAVRHMARAVTAEWKEWRRQA